MIKKMHSAIIRLIQIRETYQITAQFIAAQLQVSERNIWRWLNNNNAPTPESAEKIEQFCEEFLTQKKEQHAAELERCTRIIEQSIYDGQNEVFNSQPKVGEAAIVCPRGQLWKDVCLQTLANACQLRLNDSILLESLEAIAHAGRVKVFGLSINKTMRTDDIVFNCELGTAHRQIPSNVITPKRLYKDEAMTKEELEDKWCIFNIKERCEAERLKKKERFEKWGGASGLEMEVQLHKESVEDFATKRSEGRTVANGIEQLVSQSQGSKKTKEPGGKDMVDIIQPKVEYREVSYHNDTGRTQVFYDAMTGLKIVIEDGETKRFFKTKKVELGKPEKKVIKIK